MESYHILQGRTIYVSIKLTYRSQKGSTFYGKNDFIMFSCTSALSYRILVFFSKAINMHRNLVFGMNLLCTAQKGQELGKGKAEIP